MPGAAPSGRALKPKRGPPARAATTSNGINNKVRTRKSLFNSVGRAGGVDEYDDRNRKVRRPARRSRLLA